MNRYICRFQQRVLPAASPETVKPNALTPAAAEKSYRTALRGHSGRITHD